MIRPDLLIYVSGSTTASAVMRRGVVSDVVFRPRNGQQDLAEALGSALEYAPQKIGRVWLLTPDVWTQSVSANNDVVRRVSNAHLPQFLSFEVEPLSGVRPSEAKTAVVELDRNEERRNYWVTQTELAVFERVADVVGQFGGTFAGILHSAGAGAGLAADAKSGSFGRVEIWPDVVVGIKRGDKGVAERRFFANDIVTLAPETEKWLGPLWSSGKAELLVADGGASAKSFPFSSAKVLRLDGDDSVRVLLDTWARALARKPDVPALLPERQPMPARTRRLAAVGLAACTMLACVGHYRFSEAKNTREAAVITQQIADLREPTDRVATVRAEIDKLEKETKTFQTNQASLNEAIVRHQGRLAVSKQRILIFMKQMAESAADGLVVDSIDHDGDEMIVRGRCLHPQQANTLAKDLMRRLAPYGLKFSLPVRDATLNRHDGGPHRFAMIVRDESDGREGPKSIDLEAPQNFGSDTD